ncbi:MAG: hypothetical protein GT601_14200 [Acidaminobacter sp.]|uniref:PIN domain-containing protein n=1 Tax=Acidaminobacter sp. TaxID=1872102 RepID=UPI001385F10C|nr:PIN domain-containing protein [Acidaminobacter sp.]MZQ98816.1 hypothetical protein [Acidaminobacter sp.]
MKRENRKTHCFIDYENVHESGFEGVEALSDGDAVTIFISSASHKISLVVLETLLRKKCELNIIHTIGTGKNNLDFQLIAEVGYQIGRHTYEAQSTQFAIISKDRGYENVVTAFLNRGFQIIQCETIEKIDQNVDFVRDEPIPDELVEEWEFAASIRKCLVSLKLSPSDLKKADAIFKESLTLNTLHDRLVKAFGKKGNHPVYGKLKALHKQYQKTLPPVVPELDETMSEIHEGFVPVIERTEDLRPEDEMQSLNFHGDHLIETSNGGEVPMEAGSSAEMTELVAGEPVTHHEKPAVETKKKTRGRKRKQPAAKTVSKAEHSESEGVRFERDMDQLPVIHVESMAEGQSESQAKPEMEPHPETIQTGASADPHEKTVDKKKRRPGRPRKKNGTSKSAEKTNVTEDAGETGLVASKDPAAE